MNKANEEQPTKNGSAAAIIEAFTKEVSLDRLKEIAIALSKPGATSQAAKDDAFRDRFSRLLEQAKCGPGIDRLKALALVGRLRQQAKALSPQVRAAFRQPTDPIETPASELADPLDRTYLARILRDLMFPGRDRYLAEFIASEPVMKTEARLLATAVLLEAAPSLSRAFELLSHALRARHYDTQDPSTSRARQLLRTLESLVEGLRHTDPLVEYSVGETYSKFIASNLGTTTEIDRNAANAVAKQTLELLVAIVRPNFSLVRHPETFGAIRFTYRLFHPAHWPPGTTEPRAELAKLLKEAIALLAQSGVTDTRLREVLVLVSDEHSATSAMRTIASDTPGLSNEVKHWLETGRAAERIASADSVAETILETVDRDIARAFRDSVLLSSVSERIFDDLADAARSQSRSLEEASRLLQNRIGDVIRDCQLVARGRKLETKLHVGDIVEYAPSEHELDRAVSGSRLVRVLSPLVVRVEEGRISRVVLRAQVVSEG